jgi:putative ABC transport system ATP-binding protein
MSKSQLLVLEGVGLSYPTASGPYPALADVSLTVQTGEYVAIVGRSGSGKSSLLNIMTGIDRPTQGRVVVAGIEIATLQEGPLALWRGRSVGIVFQFFQLIPTLTVLENLMLPMELVGTIPKKDRRERARALLDQVGIEAQGTKLPGALSGGEQQRAALARALANDPPLVVADEPTGNLDSRNADLVSGLLASLAKAGKTVVVVTHERRLDSSYDRIVTLVDGRLASDERGRP